MAHIGSGHPELIPDNINLLHDTVADPDMVQFSNNGPSVLVISRWFQNFMNGKYIFAVVKVGSESEPRHWIITAYVSTEAYEGEVVWRRN